MPNLRTIALKLAGAVPPRIKNYIYARPRLLIPLAGLIKRLSPTEGEAVITVSAGPNRGMKLMVDRSVPNFFWMKEDYEKSMQDAITAAVVPGATVADIGAHMGFETLQMARLVGPRGHVHSFEPDPKNFLKLKRNCDLNELSQVQCHQTAVSNQQGFLTFQASGTPTSRIAQGGELDVIQIPTTTLDSAVATFAITGLSLVKLDVEGAELLVLQGATKALADLRPEWLIEIHSAEMLVGCVQLLLAANYRIETLTDQPYYALALESLRRGVVPDFAGFDVGHIRAIP